MSQNLDARTRSTLHAKRYWMPDKQCKACTKCEQPFNIFRRRHHCRFCGKIFCQSCSSQNMDGHAFGFDGHVRVCDDCKLMETSLLTAQLPDVPYDAGMTPAQHNDKRLEFELGIGKSALRDLQTSDSMIQTTAQPSEMNHVEAAAVSVQGGRFEREFLTGGGGITVFENKARLSRPKAPLFATPAHAAAEAVLRTMAEVADAHLTSIVHRATRQYFSEFPNPLSTDCNEKLTENQKEWADVILRLARRATASTDPNVPAGDRSDVRMYIKIKAIPDPPADVTAVLSAPSAAVSIPTLASTVDGMMEEPLTVANTAAPPQAIKVPQRPSASRIGRCELISGVVFRKNLPHKSMQADIASPRVILIDDAITFEGGIANRMVSLDTLIDQERRYTDILVSKLVALNPTVLFVSKNVSRLAQELLVTAGISVVPQVRLSVLHRISRSTGARILPSINYIDKLPEQEVVGITCSRFCVRDVFVPPDWHGAPPASKPSRYGDERVTLARDLIKRSRTSYVFLDGCPLNVGCTLLIRGHADDIGKVKSILQYAVYVARNLRLQTAYLFDAYMCPYIMAYNMDSDAVALAAGKLPAAMRNGLPFLDTTRRLRLSRWLCTLPSSPHLDLSSLISGWLVTEQGIITGAHGEQNWPSQNEIGDMLGLSESFESLAVASCSLADGAQCSRPRLRVIQFYAHNDRSLGQYLEKRFDDRQEPCRSCKRSHFAHTVSYIHNRGRLDVTVHRLTQPISNWLQGAAGSIGSPRVAEDVILSKLGSPTKLQPTKMPPQHTIIDVSPLLHQDTVMWSYCSGCKSFVSPLTRMSRGAWSLSFGKFLELTFYGALATRSADGRCPHNPFAHVRYFSKGRTAVVFRLVPIVNVSVSLKLSCMPDYAWGKAAMEREIEGLLRASAVKSTELFAAIKDTQQFIAVMLRSAGKLASVEVGEDLSSTPHRMARPSKFAQLENLPNAMPSCDSPVTHVGAIDTSSGAAVADAVKLSDDSEASRLRPIRPPQNMASSFLRQMGDVLSNAGDALAGAPRTPGAPASQTTRMSITTGPGQKPPSAAPTTLPIESSGLAPDTVLWQLRAAAADLATMNQNVSNAQESLTRSLQTLMDAVGCDVNELIRQQKEMDILAVVAVRREFVLQINVIDDRFNSLRQMVIRASNVLLHALEEAEVVLATPVPSSEAPAPSPAEGFTPDEHSAQSKGLRTIHQRLATPRVQSQESASAFSGHLSLPVGMQQTVVAVNTKLLSSMVAFSLCAEVYWLQLQKCVVAAWQRQHGFQDTSNQFDEAGDAVEQAADVEETDVTSTDRGHSADDGTDDQDLDSDDFSDEEDLDGAGSEVDPPASEDRRAASSAVSSPALKSEDASRNSGALATPALASSIVRDSTGSATARISLAPHLSLARGTPKRTPSILPSPSQLVKTISFRADRSAAPLAVDATPAPKQRFTLATMSPSLIPQGHPSGVFSPQPARVNATKRGQQLRRHSIGSPDPVGLVRENRFAMASPGVVIGLHRQDCQTPCRTGQTSVNLASAGPDALPLPPRPFNSYISPMPIKVGSRHHRMTSLPTQMDSVRKSLGRFSLRSGDLHAITMLLPAPPTMFDQSQLVSLVEADNDADTHGSPSVHSADIVLAEFALAEAQKAARSLQLTRAPPAPPGGDVLLDSAPVVSEDASVTMIANAIAVATTEQSVSTSTAVMSFPTPAHSKVRRRQTSFLLNAQALGVAPIPEEQEISEQLSAVLDPALVPGVADARENQEAMDQLQEAINDTVRAESNFGVTLPLPAADMLVSDVKTDIVHTFADTSGNSPAQFTVTYVWAVHFHALRELYMGSQRSFVQSLAFAEDWQPSGGKSGAKFERTVDRRFILKTVTKSEFDMFNEYIAASYFQHMHAALVDGTPSLLVKILGAFKICFETAIPGGGMKRQTSYAIVMEDLFHRRAVPPGLKFDLKGKQRAQKKPSGAETREVPVSASALHPTATERPSDSGSAATEPVNSTAARNVFAEAEAGVASLPVPVNADASVVLLDGDFMAYTKGYPLPLTEDAKRLLEATVEHDTTFLCGIKVIDYSVLLGIEPETGEMVIGVIDYIRRYDLLRKLETRVKTVTQLATNIEPTVVQPERYKERLQRALDRYFVLVPTKWTEFDDDTQAH